MKTLKFRVKTLAIALPVAGMFFLGCSDDDDDIVGVESPPPQASAEIRGYTDSTIWGTVTFQEQNDSLIVQGAVSGLVSGNSYGVHVHQYGDCTAPDSSGGHFAMQGQIHGNPFIALPLHHSGDLPNLEADESGVGHFEIVTPDITLGTDSLSVVGRSVVVHALTDDYVTQPAGGTGARIACGVIERVDEDGKTDTLKVPTEPVPGAPGY